MKKWFLLIVMAIAFISPAFAEVSHEDTFAKIQELHGAKKFKEALDFCSRDDISKPICAYSDGVIYESGLDGSEKDRVKACNSYKISADGEIVGGLHNYGNCLYDGIGTEKDVAKAADYYQKAYDINQYSVSAKFLGDAYRLADGRTEDFQKAVEFYNVCADSGDGYCAYQLFHLKVDKQVGDYTVDELAERMKSVPKDRLTEDQYKIVQHWFKMRERTENQRRMLPGVPELLGVKLAGALRVDMRDALKRAGAKAIREDYSYWNDTYDITDLGIAGATKAYVYYSMDSDSTTMWNEKMGFTDTLSRVFYEFPVKYGKTHTKMEELKAAIESKYGKMSSRGFNQFVYDGSNYRILVQSVDSNKVQVVYIVEKFWQMEKAESDENERQKKAKTYKGAVESGKL